MNHRLLQCVLLITVLTLVSPIRATEDDGEKGARPNVIFIFADDHATQAISAYGSRINETPHIDRLAEQGMLFRNCFVTNAICAPSRAAVLTGKFSHMNGVCTNAERFDGSQQTFPKLLREAGYETAMIGKWHLKSDPTGFDHWEILPGQGHYYNPDFRTVTGRRQYEGYVTEVTTDLALNWLRAGRDEGRPFMLMVHHKAPHRNWMPGPRQLMLYDDGETPEPQTLFDDYAGRAGGAAQQEMTIGRHMSGMYDLKLPERFDEFGFKWEGGYLDRLTAGQRAAWDAAYGPRNEAYREALAAGRLKGDELVRYKYERYVKDYLRCIASVDENVGRLLDYLEEAGLAENTVVVYSSDQGFFLGEHGWYDKRWMYEPSLRMPLLVRWPGRIAAGSVTDLLVQNVDFAPTFLDFAGVAKPEDMQGRSLVGVLRGERPSDWRRGVYYHYYEYPAVHMVPRHYGVRTDRYKLIHYYQRGEWELFDLMTDPEELRSVYDEAAYSRVVASLKTELARLRARYRDHNPQTPSDRAVVLFDGSGFSDWTGENGGPVRWEMVEGAMEVVPGAGSIVTKEPYGDVQLHVEFRVPNASASGAEGSRANRGNSGVYLQRRYEVQILDSFGVAPDSFDCGALYRAKAPDVNASRPAGAWQTYDIMFRGARFADREGARVKVGNARITVIHNGVLIHDDVELADKTGAGRREGPEPGPIMLQDHGSPVQFRNIWVQPIEGAAGK